MSKYYLYSLFLVLVAYAVSVESDPTDCYHCTLLNLNACNSPLNKEHTGTQSCSNIHIVGNHHNTTAKTVCYHVTATWVGIPISERGCYYAEMDGEDLCSFFKRTEASGAFTKDYTCNICDSDRCNEVPSPACTLVKYSRWADVGDLGIWTTLEFAPVFVSRMRFCTILCGTAVIFLLLANLFAIIGQCNSDNKTIVACGLFILSGLSLGTGLVIFASSLSETVLEISQYHREPSFGPVYDHQYGWCFFAAGVAFIMTNMAALFSISGYLNRFASVDEMVRQMVPGAERKLLEHQYLSNEYLVRLAGPSSLQYDPLPTERPKYEQECGPLLNKTPPDVCTTNQCHDFGVEDLDRACVLAGIVETGYNVAQTLAGQTIPITIKNHNSTAPLSFSNVPMKYGTMQLESPATLQCTSALHQGFLGVTDLGSSSSTSSSGYCGRSKTLGYKNKKKCEKAEAFEGLETSFADFGKRTTNEFSFSGSAV